RYIIAPKGLKAGDQVIAGSNAPIKAGNTLPLRNIPVGTTVHCIELKPGKGAQIARAAGAGVQLVAREGAYALVRLRSARCARSRPSAVPPSAKSATTSTTWRSWARPAPSVGAAFARPSAVRR